MEPNTEIHKLAPKVPELYYDETAANETDLVGQLYTGLILGVASVFETWKLNIAVISPGKLMLFLGSSLYLPRKYHEN